MKILYNNIWIIILYIFIIFSIIFTIFIKPQFLDTKNNENIENFDNINNLINNTNDTTLSLYKNNHDFHKDNPFIKDYTNKYLYKHDVNFGNPLFTFMCIKHKIDTNDDTLEIRNMVTKLYKHFFINVNDIYVNNMNDIINKISESIDYVLINSGDLKLKGPVYVILYQAPYLRYNDNEIEANFNMNNMKPSYIQNNKDVIIGSKSLFYKILILYPYYFDYNNIGKLNRINNENGMIAFKNYFNDSILSRNNLCFIELNNDNKLAGGCLNRNGVNNFNDSDFYKSTCINEQKEMTNYGMMYIVNNKYKSFEYKFENNN